MFTHIHRDPLQLWEWVDLNGLQGGKDDTPSNFKLVHANTHKNVHIHIRALFFYTVKYNILGSADLPVSLVFASYDADCFPSRSTIVEVVFCPQPPEQQPSFYRLTTHHFRLHLHYLKPYFSSLPIFPGGLARFSCRYPADLLEFHVSHTFSPVLWSDFKICPYAIFVTNSDSKKSWAYTIPVAGKQTIKYMTHTHTHKIKGELYGVFTDNTLGWLLLFLPVTWLLTMLFDLHRISLSHV